MTEPEPPRRLQPWTSEQKWTFAIRAAVVVTLALAVYCAVMVYRIDQRTQELQLSGAGAVAAVR